MFPTEILMGVNDGPPSSLNYKRAILRSAPREFTVEVLNPTKHGGNFSYGMKICPIVRSSNSSDSRSLSSRSTSSHSEYEIWRRWEDCLDFQVTLEDEYSTLSRQKVKVLRRGAHGKRKNDNESVYSMPKLAASFDSLPEGPDPREVVLDVHEIVPTLTRKGTLFRVSKATAEQRGREFAAFISGLFNADPDAPVLLQELRNTQSIRDFFGYWRRDKDLAEKAGKDVKKFLHSNKSMTSISSAYTYTTGSQIRTGQFTGPSTPVSHSFTEQSSLSIHLRHSTSSQLLPTQRLEQIRQSKIPPASAPPQTADRRFIPESPPSTRPTFPIDNDFSANVIPSGTMTFTDELLLRDERDSIPLSSHVRPSHVRPIPPTSGARRPFVNPEFPAPTIHSQYPSRPLVSEVSRGNHLSHNPRVQYPILEEALPPRPIPRVRSNSAVTPDHRKGRVFVTTSENNQSSSLKIRADNRPNTASGHPTSPDSGPTNYFAPSPSTPSVAHSLRQSLLLSPASSHSNANSVSSRFSNLSVTRSSVTSSISAFTEASKRFSGQSQITEDHCESDDEDLCASFPTPLTMQHISSSALYDIDEGLPSTTPNVTSNTWRESVASFSSLRTDTSADGVLPLHLRQEWNIPHDPRRGPDVHDAHLIDGEDFIDSYYNDPDHSDSIKFSMDAFDKDLQQHNNDTKRHSVSSASSSGSLGNTHSGLNMIPDIFAIKAAYHDHVIVFRADRDMSLVALRQRIQERFELHESVPIKNNFVLAYVSSKTNGRKRSNSVTSSISNMSQLRLLQVDLDWQAVMATSNGKVTLRVLDPERQTPYF